MLINFFSTKGCNAFKATFPRKFDETDEAWNLGLKVPVLRLQCNSPMIMTFQGAPIDSRGDPMAPIPGQRRFGDDPSLIMQKF